MAKLLYVEASPRKERSHSIAVAREFLRVYRDVNRDDEVETLDLWSTELPSFDGRTLAAKYRILHGQDATPDEAEAWKAVVEVFEHFAAADKYLFSLPMWNFGIPYRLKHYIDVLTQPGLAFTVSPETGYVGQVTGKPAAVIYARGGAYSGSSPAAPMDHQRPYMETWLAFIGFSDVQSIVVEKTLGGPEAAAAAETAAKLKAVNLAAGF
jgi:FMN-dependent NADH-azoreductase